MFEAQAIVWAPHQVTVKLGVFDRADDAQAEAIAWVNAVRLAILTGVLGAWKTFETSDGTHWVRSDKVEGFAALAVDLGGGGDE